jgi:hypothetical protein
MNLDQLISLEMQKIKSLIEDPLNNKKETKKYIKQSIKRLFVLNYYKR